MLSSLLAISLWLGGTGIAEAARVSGAIDLPDPAPTAAEDAPATHYWEEPNGFFPTRSDRSSISTELLVVLIAKSGGASPPPSQLEIVGGEFIPTTFAVSANSRLRITNTDPCNHELYSDELEAFRASPTPPGGTLEVPAGNPGNFIIRDRHESGLRATVHVLKNLVARAAVSRTGNFVFDGVSAGSYSLEVYRGSEKVAARQVTVEDDVELTTPLSLRSQGR